MKTEQFTWSKEGGWSAAPDGPPSAAQLALVFGGPTALRDPALRSEIRRRCPVAVIAGCSTAGEICGTAVSDDGLVVTALSFAHTQVRAARVAHGDYKGSRGAGEALARALPREIPGGADAGAAPLAHVIIFSDGLVVNGSELVSGVCASLPPGVTPTGGLAGDGTRFGETLTLLDETVGPGAIIGVGLYGARVRVGYGSLGGWDSFGAERVVTRARGNVLYELDGQSALKLYKNYLGDQAAGLPATGLLFPLSLSRGPGQTPVVRTILNVDEANQSMTFAGDVPEGSRVRLMKANFDRLIDGATGAARTSHEALQNGSARFGLLISCVGRKLVLKQRTEDEVEGVRDVLGAQAALTGFYSYGEISPFAPGCPCELHNQTMTITTLAEA